MIIGICGGTCSGKTTLSYRLKQLLGSKISVISIDNYYKSYPELTFEERKRINYDEPDSINVTKLIDDIDLLNKGQGITQPSFSFKTFLNEESNNVTYPADVIIVEGLFAFSLSELVRLYDFKIYIDIDADIRLSRRILRDLKVHNRPLDYILKQYFNYVKPMHNLYIEPQKNIADIIISGDFNQDKIYDMILNMVSI